MGNDDCKDVPLSVTLPLLLLVLIVGPLVTIFVLVIKPTTYRFLRNAYENLCHKYGRDVIKLSDLERNRQRETNYTEIEEGRAIPGSNSNRNTNQEVAEAVYEGCDTSSDPNRREHSYTDIENKGTAQQTSKTGEGYEYVSMQSKLNKQSNHTAPVYAILEPGSNKRLPVKMVTDEDSDLASDPSHVYFVLEPGTKKVTPVFQESLRRDADQVYFVLEADASMDTEAYAVSDVESMYFILEQQ